MPHTISQCWVHSECLNKFAYRLGRHVEFIPHWGSIDTSKPNQSTIQLAQAPTREAITQKMQAMQNSTFTNPPINKKLLNQTMKVWTEKLSGKIVTMVFFINIFSSINGELKRPWTHSKYKPQASAIGAMTMEFQLSNQRLQVIAQTLGALPGLPAPHHLTASSSYVYRKSATSSTSSPAHMLSLTIHIKATTHIMNSFVLISYQCNILFFVYHLFIYQQRAQSSLVDLHHSPKMYLFKLHIFQTPPN